MRVPLMVALLVRGLLRARRPEGSYLGAAARGSANAILAVGGLVLAFFLLWGLNHGREPFAVHAGIDLAPPTRGTLDRVSREILEDLIPGSDLEAGDQERDPQQGLHEKSHSNTSTRCIA